MQDDVDRIVRNLSLDRDKVFFVDAIRQVENPFRSVWTTVYSSGIAADGVPSVFCCLARPEMKQKILSACDWPVHADSFSPGFEESFEGGSRSVKYLNGLESGYSYLVAEEYFHPMDEQQFIVNSEFLLLFNLYRGLDGDYYSIGESGEREKVVRFGKSIQFLTSYLMRFIAAKQLLFVQLVDARYGSDSHYRHQAEKIHEIEQHGDNFNYSMWFSATTADDYLFSMVYARSVVDPGPVDKCGVWPYDVEDDDYPEFWISQNPDGSKVRFTCDPDKLGTYFGDNPEAPHYLTPVYFKPGVLDKYRNSDYFNVSERRLSCGSQWGVEIDHVIPSRVMVYLGDLGRDMPASERKHFLEYEMSPISQNISYEAYANDFNNLWVEPSGPISSLLCARDRLDDIWLYVFGRQLFRKPHPDDANMDKLIRIPSSNGREEFDTVILNLQKFIIDYIDDSQFPQDGESGSINRFAKFLKEKNIRVDIAPLRDLQDLRSTGSAHAKGKKYDKVKRRVLTGDNVADVERLIGELTDMMNEMSGQLNRAVERD